jgi:midasin
VHAARKKTLSDEDESTMVQFQREWEERETAFRIERASFLLPKVCEKEQNEDGSNIEVERIYTLECAELEDGYEREQEESIPAAPGYERLGAIEVRAKRDDDDNNGVNDINASASAKMNNNNKKKNSSNASDFVLVPSAERNLVAVAYALCQNRPVLLEGPAGCGKSATLREAARRFGRSSEDNDVIVLHFDAHTDSKSLLGAYVCGASPGEFEWQPGSLTRAVKTGKWVLIEDVDVAPFEVLSALIPLLEERKLYIAGRGETVVAHPQFQLFGSATVGGSKVSNRENDPLSGLWTRVSVEQPSGDEPGKILAELYPQFGEADIKGRMLKTMRVAQTMVGQGGGHPMRLTGLGDERFDNKNADDNDDDNEMMIDAEKIHPDDANEIDLAVEDARKMTSLEDLASSEAASSSRASVGRPFTLRDLLRWAKRATALRKTELKLMKKGKAPPPQTRQAMYDEAADVLLGALPPGIGRRKALQAVAEIWGLNPEETANTTDLFRKPDVMSSEDSVRVGRTMLPFEENENTVDGFRNFAKTGHALRMLERVSCAVSVNEPALLVGETGTGKTALVQELARLTGAPLTVVNLSNQSESSDFLGGFRPAGSRHLCLPLLKRFLELFGETFPSRSNAEFLGRVSKFADKRKWIHLLKAFRAGVDRVASVVDKDDEDKMVDSSEHGEDPPSNDNDMEEATPAVVAAPPTTRATRSQATGKKGKDEKVSTSSVTAETSNKRQKTSAATKKKTGSATKKEAAKKSTLTISDDLVESWQSFDRDLVVAERAIGDVASSSGGGPIFAFVEGALVTALREGHWILLDEINLAPAETLERLNGVLESRKGSIVLSERGDATPVYRHPRFRLFAAMNPATDVGKRDLPPALKHRFAEVYCGETESREDLQLLVRGYLRDVPSGVIAPIVDFYVEAKRAAHTILLDSADQKPRYSLRTLARALEYVSAASPLYGVQRAMMDGFSMSFLTLLKKEGQEILEKLMHKHLLGGKPIKVSKRSFIHRVLLVSVVKRWACQYSMACSV